MFRLGTTSYILPDDILPNARYLAGKVQDIELVLFEVDDGPNNLPGAEVLDELVALAKAHDLTYTVHLPLDLRLGTGGEAGHASLVKARKVIERTRLLQPWAYVLHLDGKEVQEGASQAALHTWQGESARALELAAGWAGDPALLAVENLEGYPPDFLDPVLELIPASRCLDIGHLWLDEVDPLPFLEARLPRTRVIHLHAIGERDHQSLALAPAEKLDPVLACLRQKDYRGVVTMEVFGEQDFHSSLERITEVLNG